MAGAGPDGVVRRVVVDHVALRVRNLAASRRFYEAALAPLGFGILHADEEGAAFGVEGADDLYILAGGTPTVGVHVAFAAGDRSVVDDFYREALRTGGRDNGGPGLRPEYHEGYYGAFVLDPDGNNVEAVYHDRG